MPSEAFFSTTAQVLPTLLIAFAVEGGLLLRDPLNGWRQRLRLFYARMYRDMEKDPDWPSFDNWIGRVLVAQTRNLRKEILFFAYLVLVLIAGGEIVATAVLFLGRPDNWITKAAGIVCVIAMTCATVISAAVPVARLRLETGLRLVDTLPKRSPLEVRLA
ncbi:hypothetical protein [Paractinoplanes atraurantiacus]|uniref:Uncharacterized protein n=1 Tax=Paractinoplanes atraurantiacus TaxID=1036182 RepID=A0A285KFF8_9ACTN|nr:hypothetical protein [Actinoplanes atraurantiacus]SNY70166.1 hypothetical protein SAMN05421748_13730 [Actinoplanes atraurantiacus]